METKKAEATREIEALKLLLPAERDAYKRLAASAMRYYRLLKQLEIGHWDTAADLQQLSDLRECEDEAIFVEPKHMDLWYLFRQEASNTKSDADKAAPDPAALKDVWSRHQRQLYLHWDEFMNEARHHLTG